MLESQLFAVLVGALVGGAISLMSTFLVMRNNRRRRSKERLAELSVTLQDMLRDVHWADPDSVQNMALSARIHLMKALPWTGGRLSQSLFLRCIQSSTNNLRVCAESLKGAREHPDQSRYFELTADLQQYTVAMDQIAQLLVLRHPVAVCVTWADEIEKLNKLLNEEFRRSPYLPILGSTLVATWWAERTLWRNFTVRTWSSSRGSRSRPQDLGDGSP